eukprot:3729791-Pleurochrysis_carterae.AAC.1
MGEVDTERVSFWAGWDRKVGLVCERLGGIKIVGAGLEVYFAFRRSQRRALSQTSERLRRPRFGGFHNVLQDVMREHAKEGFVIEACKCCSSPQFVSRQDLCRLRWDTRLLCMVTVIRCARFVTRAPQVGVGATDGIADKTKKRIRDESGQVVQQNKRCARRC